MALGRDQAITDATTGKAKAGEIYATPLRSEWFLRGLLTAKVLSRPAPEDLSYSNAGAKQRQRAALSSALRIRVAISERDAAIC